MQKCLSKAVDLVCRNCSGVIGDVEDGEDMTLDGDVIKKVTKFSYLGDVRNSEGGVQEAVTARIRSG